MESNRRKFMATVGAMFASAVTLSCSPVRRIIASCYVPVRPTNTPIVTCYAAPPPTPAPGQFAWNEAWQNLARPWYSLDALAQAAGDDKAGPEMRDALAAEHEKALQTLVSTGEVDDEVAADLQAAFEGAAYHIWRANSNMTCYVPTPPPDYEIESRGGLAEQAKVLSEMAERSGIDETTVSKAEAAIERDITFLAMNADDRKALLEAVREAAGSTGQYPELSELDMEVPESAVTAAHLLVQLLSGPVQSQ